MCICCVNHLVPGWSMCCRWRNCTRRILWVKSLETDETGPTHKEHKGKRMMSYKAIINGSTYIPYLMLGSLVYSALDWRASSWSLFLSSIRCRFATDPSKGWGVVILGKQRCQNIRVPSATSYPLVNTGDRLMSHRLCAHNQWTSSSWLHLTPGHTSINSLPTQQCTLDSYTLPFSRQQILKLVHPLDRLLQANNNTTQSSLKFTRGRRVEYSYQEVYTVLWISAVDCFTSYLSVNNTVAFAKQ